MKRKTSDWISTFCEYTKKIEVPKSYKEFTAVSVISAALERKCWYDWFMPVYPNMYIFLVGPAGSKKTSITKFGTHLLGETEVFLAGTKASSAAFLDQFVSAGMTRSFIWQGQNYPMSSVFLYAPEAKASFQEIYGDLITDVTDLFDCGNPGWTLKIPSIKKLLRNEQVVIFNPSLTILACTTPDWLAASIGQKDFNAGFGSRILFVNETKLVPPIKDGHIGPHKDPEFRRTLSHDLAQIHTQIQGPYSPTNDFTDLLHNIRVVTADFQNEHPNHPLASYYARKPTQLIKLSQIVAASESNEMLLTEKHLRRAFEMMTLLEDKMSDAFSTGAADNKYMQTAAILYDKIVKLKRHGMPYLQAKKIARMKHSQNEIYEVLQCLVDNFSVEIIEQGAAGRLLRYRPDHQDQ